MMIVSEVGYRGMGESLPVSSGGDEDAEGSLAACVRARYTFARGGSATPQLHVPASAMLNGHSVCSIGRLDGVADFEELNLSNNKLDAWEEVHSLLAQQPRLRILQLTGNPLPVLTAPVARDIAALSHNLARLSLSCVPGLSWDTVSALMAALPNLDTLRLCNNGFHDIPKLPRHTKLRSLFLSDNHIRDFAAVLRLRHLPLRTLNLRRNPIANLCAAVNAHQARAVETGAEAGAGSGEGAGAGEGASNGAGAGEGARDGAGTGAGARDGAGAGAGAGSDAESVTRGEEGDAARGKYTVDGFMELETLYLSHTQLGTWNDILSLRAIPSLRSVTLQHLPVLETVKHDQRTEKQALAYIRNLVVSCLPHVTHVNNSRVQARDRTMAERAYIRHHRYSGPGGEQVDDATLPHRYHELIAKHGHMNPLANVSFSARKRWADVVIRGPLVQASLGVESEETQVEYGGTVRALKKRLAKMVRVPASKLRIVHWDAKLMELKRTHGNYFRTHIEWGDSRTVDAKMLHDGDELELLEQMPDGAVPALADPSQQPDIDVTFVLPTDPAASQQHQLASTFGGASGSKSVTIAFPANTQTAELMSSAAAALGIDDAASVDFVLERKPYAKKGKPDHETLAFVRARAAASSKSAPDAEPGKAEEGVAGAEAGKAEEEASGAESTASADEPVEVRRLERMRFPRRTVSLWFHGHFAGDRVLVLFKSPSS